MRTPVARIILETPSRNGATGSGSAFAAIRGSSGRLNRLLHEWFGLCQAGNIHSAGHALCQLLEFMVDLPAGLVDGRDNEIFEQLGVELYDNDVDPNVPVPG